METIQVASGVSCDTYSFTNDKSKDLALIHIKPGCKTPLQKVLKGEKTVEGYLSGNGRLVVIGKNETEDCFICNSKSPKPAPVTVSIGEIMQWQADNDSPLEAFEICYPPYKEGRFENIT